MLTIKLSRKHNKEPKKPKNTKPVADITEAKQKLTEMRQRHATLKTEKG